MFDPGPCPKCGSDNLKIRYQWDRSGEPLILHQIAEEHMDVRCKRCGYGWEMPLSDGQPEKPQASPAPAEPTAEQLLEALQRAGSWNMENDVFSVPVPAGFRSNVPDFIRNLARALWGKQEALHGPA